MSGSRSGVGRLASCPGTQSIALVYFGTFCLPSPLRKRCFVSPRALPAWCSRLAGTAPIPHSAFEGEGQVALHPPERTHCSNPLRGSVRRFRYCGYPGFCCLVCSARQCPLSGSLVGLPAAIVVNCIFNRKFDCTLVGMNLLLTGQYCTDKSELDFQARLTCFTAAYRVTRNTPSSTSSGLSTRRRSSPCSACGGRYVRRGYPSFLKVER